MNIKPVASPSAIQQVTSNATEAKARAVAAFNQASQAQVQTPQTAQVVAQPVVQAAEEQEPIQESQVIESTEQVQESPEKQAASRRFAQLALQEKQLRQRAAKQEQDYRQRMAELDAKEQQYKQAPQFDPSKYIERDRLKQDAWSVLAEEGLTYEQIAQQMLNDTPTDPRVSREMQALKAQIQELKQLKEDEKKQQAEAQTQQYQAAVKQIETEARQLVQNDPTYEAIKATNSVRDVVDLIEQTYNKDGILLSVEEAAEQVENYLVDQALKFTSIGKIKQRLDASSAQKPQVTAQKTSAEQPQSQMAKTAQPQMKTLTNTTAVTRQLSARERALLAFKGELK